MANDNSTRQQALEITVDDGSQRIAIKNLDGEEIGVFRFRPTDVAIIQRYNEVANKFDEILAPLEDVSIAADGTAEDGNDKSAEALNEAEKRLFEACDYIFDGNVSEAFFGKMHPFSPVNGVFYCESVLAKLGDFIAGQFQQETKKINKRLNQYVGKYGPKGKTK